MIGLWKTSSMTRLDSADLPIGARADRLAISADGMMVAAGGHLNDPRFGMIDLFRVEGRKLVPMRGK